MNINIKKIAYTLYLCTFQSLLANEAFNRIKSKEIIWFVDYHEYALHTPLPIPMQIDTAPNKINSINTIINSELRKTKSRTIQYLILEKKYQSKLLQKNLSIAKKLAKDCNQHLNNLNIEPGGNIAYKNILKCVKKYNKTITLSTLKENQFVVYIELQEYIAKSGCLVGQMLPLTPIFKRVFIYRVFVLESKTQKIVWFNSYHRAMNWIQWYDEIDYEFMIHSVFTQNLLGRKDL